MKVGEYYYNIRGRHFHIYQCTHSDSTGTMASPVPNEPFYSDREAVRRRVYELNGWNYKPKENK